MIAAIVLDQGRNAFEGPGRELLQNRDVVSLYVGSMQRALRRVAARNDDGTEPRERHRRPPIRRPRAYPPVGSILALRFLLP